MTLTRYADIPAYVTKDGSLIRELMHPALHGNHACKAWPRPRCFRASAPSCIAMRGPKSCTTSPPVAA
jgi:hypothetical protein